MLCDWIESLVYESLPIQTPGCACACVRTFQRGTAPKNLCDDEPQIRNYALLRI